MKCGEHALVILLYNWLGENVASSNKEFLCRDQSVEKTAKISIFLKGIVDNLLYFIHKYRF